MDKEIEDLQCEVASAIADVLDDMDELPPEPTAPLTPRSIIIRRNEKGTWNPFSMTLYWSSGEIEFEFQMHATGPVDASYRTEVMIERLIESRNIAEEWRTVDITIEACGAHELMSDTPSGALFHLGDKK